MTVAQQLEKASGVFFFSGFLFSKLQYIPYPLVSSIFRFFSLAIYFLGHSCGSIACLFYPNHKEHRNKWYGFTQIKNQFLLSSLVGVIATGISVGAVFLPILFPIAAWLFLVGNAFWIIGEYHKLKNPPQSNSNYSYFEQENYLGYAMASSTITLATAVAATFIFIFPPLMVPITIFSLFLYAGLGTLSLHYWLKSGRLEQLQQPLKESYNKICNALGPSCSPKCSNSLESSLSKGMFNNLKDKVSKIERSPSYQCEVNRHEHDFQMSTSF